MKIKIVEVISSANEETKRRYFFLKRKCLFGWKPICHEELPSIQKRLEFDSMKEAEDYIVTKQITWGHIEHCGMIYDYEPYSLGM